MNLKKLGIIIQREYLNKVKKKSFLLTTFGVPILFAAIYAVMLYDAKLSQEFAAKMAEEGIFVTGFYYPVVPKGQARIRVQLSAAHRKEHLDKAIAAFIKVGKELGVLK
jgi:glycine C-acetyltransferase